MTRRAELEEQTMRRRITESTLALHEELGSVRMLLPVWQETPRHGLASSAACISTICVA